LVDSCISAKIISVVLDYDYNNSNERKIFVLGKEGMINSVSNIICVVVHLNLFDKNLRKRTTNRDAVWRTTAHDVTMILSQYHIASFNSGKMSRSLETLVHVKQRELWWNRWY
jgi:hypothetical protein